MQVTGYDNQLRQGISGPTSVFTATDGDEFLVPVSTGPSIVPSKSKIMIPCYDGGPSEGNDGPAFVSFPYEVNGVADMFGGSEASPNMDATIHEIGATWGVAFQPSYKKAFTSALVKRHVGLGPEGSGGLYTIDYNTTPPTVEAFSLQGITPAQGPVIDLGSVLRESVSGNIDETMPYALTSQPNTATYDMDAFAKVGKGGFGDIDLTEDFNQLWMVNLHQRSLIAMDVSDATTSITSDKLKHYPIGNMSGLPNLNFRYTMCINTGGNKNENGAEPFTDRNTISWDKNKYSLGGTSAYSSASIANLDNPITKTSGRLLYQTYRFGDFSYDIPIPTAEAYTVILHFAEPNNYVEGDRLFDIYLEGNLVSENFDVVKEAGGNKTAVAVSFPGIAGSGGTFTVELKSKQGNKTKAAIL